MSDPEPSPVIGPATDLEYDLAHEATGPDAGHPDSTVHLDSTVRPEGMGSREAVVTATPGYDGGDYSYDLAHDIPGR
jgi:hypothetical protein